MKLMHGDELRLRYLGELHKPWSGVGHVIKIPDSILDACPVLLVTAVYCKLIPSSMSQNLSHVVSFYHLLN